MKIYRIEHPKTKKGPYNSITIFPIDSAERKILELMRKEHVSIEGKLSHPGPVTDKIPFSPFSHIFGFPSLEKLYEWFDNFIDYLLRIGFKIKEIIVPDEFVYQGKSGKQVAYNPNEVVYIKDIV